MLQRWMTLLLVGMIAMTAILTGCAKAKDPAAGAGESEPPVVDVAPEPDPTTPQGAIAELMLSAKVWDTETVNGYLPDGVTVEGNVPAAMQGSLQALLNRMQYTVGEASIDGDRATVQMEITAADAGSAVGDAVAAVAAYAVKQQITGKGIVDYEELVQVAIDAMEIDKLPTTTAEAEAHMIQDADGNWKLDMQNKENLPFLNAVTGGVVDVVQSIAELAEGYGLTN